jgi:hypothetical protein
MPEFEEQEQALNFYSYERGHGGLKGMNNGCCMLLTILEHAGTLPPSV